MKCFTSFPCYSTRWTSEGGFVSCLRSKIFAPCLLSTRVWGWESYQQIRAKRQPSYIPQTHFQMVLRLRGEKLKLFNQAKQPKPLLAHLFRSLSWASSHLRISPGGCLINSSGLHFGEVNPFIIENKLKARFFFSAFVVTVIWNSVQIATWNFFFFFKKEFSCSFVLLLFLLFSFSFS